MFDKAVNYVSENHKKFFDLGHEEFFDFEIIRGNKKANCWLEYEHCNYCGGDVNIAGGYDED